MYAEPVYELAVIFYCDGAYRSVLFRDVREDIDAQLEGKLKDHLSPEEIESVRSTLWVMIPGRCSSLSFEDIELELLEYKPKLLTKYQRLRAA